MCERKEEGFSYIDVIIAMMILMVGILAMLSAIAGGVVLSRGQAQQLEAKHLATTALESIMSVKETDSERLGWPKIGNVGSNPNANNVAQGIFLTGRQPVRSEAGADEVIGTADDTGAAIPGYDREIQITDVCDPDRPSYNCPTPGSWPVRIRSVQIIVRYRVGTAIRQEQIRTVLTDYSVEN
jgi:type II secretory pathway pseudopilin PulG